MGYFQVGRGIIHCLVEHLFIHGLADLPFSFFFFFFFAGAGLKGIDGSNGGQRILFYLFNMVTS